MAPTEKGSIEAPFLPLQGQTFEFLLYSLIRLADPGFVNAAACVKMRAVSRYQDESGHFIARDRAPSPRMDGCGPLLLISRYPLESSMNQPHHATGQTRQPGCRARIARGVCLP